MKKDWIEVGLGEVLKTTSGGTPSRGNPNYYLGSIPWVKSGELNQNTILETEEHISEEAVKNSSAKIFPKGTLLIALYGATIGKLAFLGISAATNQAVCGIFENEALESKFLYYFLLYNRRKLVEQGAGGAQPNISQTILKNLPIVVAPLPEQRAIVARIEELFSELDHSISSFKAAKAKLEIYRQAVFKKAFEGHNEIRFEGIVDSSQNGLAKRKGLEGLEIKVLRLADIKNLIIDSSAPRTIILDRKELERYKLFKGDLVAIRVNGSKDLVGRFVLVNEREEFDLWAYCDHFIRFALDKTKCISKFYFYFFQLPRVRKFINHNMVSSAGQNTVSQGTLKSINVPLIPIEDQVLIVQEIETRLSVSDKLAETIEINLKKSEALRQSILKKAFEGKLLSEPELEACRKEADWEPAEKLLERIKEEKRIRFKS